MTRKALATLALLFACLAVLPAVAGAASRDRVIQDCAFDGALQGSYTAQELRDARQNLPVDVAEYTDCSDVLRRAELALRAQSNATQPATPFQPDPGGGETLGTPAGEVDPNDLPTEFDGPALAAAAESADQAVDVGPVKLVPASGVRVDRSEIPSELIVAVAALVLCGLLLSAPGLRRRLRALRG